MRITVAGLGHVGLSNAVLLARQHQVCAIDIDRDRVAALNVGQAPIADADCGAWLASGTLDLRATTDPVDAYRDADLIIIATSTHYDAETHAFDTSSIEAVIRLACAIQPGALMLIKSTVPVGYTRKLCTRTGCSDILYAPEFLRTGHALHDTLHPNRIIVGEVSARGAQLAEVFRAATLEPNVPVLLTDPTEAEAIKLFADTCLAMRVAFFNEVDTMAMATGLNAAEVIGGLSMNPDIGDGYNTPSFGYGGYGLPGDSRQLLANASAMPQQIMSALVEANAARKRMIADAIIARRPRRVGIYRLAMKQGADNVRESAVQDIIAHLRAAGVDTVIHEPAHPGPDCAGHPVENDFGRFCDSVDLIVANRMAAELAPVAHKVFTRDVSGMD